mgnify:CR=1 FL=1
MVCCGIKYVRQTRREIDEGTVREVYEDGFPEPKSKPFTYVDDEYAERTIRCSRTYYEYADLFRKRFPRGCPSAKQRMPCSRIAAWSSGGRPRSIGRSPSFCSSGMRQMVSVG